MKLQLPSNFRRIPTPRTNAVAAFDETAGEQAALAELARQLERELTVALSQLEALRASHAATTWRDAMGT